MDKKVLEEGRYRVLLIGIGENSKEEKDSFCHNLSKNYSISFRLLKKIVERCPIILKKNLSLKKAEILAKTLKSFGATVSVEERRNIPPISLEFQELVPHLLALESSYLRKSPKGTWSLIGRIKNISDEMLNDTWILVQLFDFFEEFINFEETPLTLNPLPPGEISPFKVVFEGDFTIKKISIAFKNASGQPIPAVDKRRKREWIEVEIDDEDEHFLSSQKVSSEIDQRSSIIELTEPSEEMVMDGEGEISIETISPIVEELDISLGERKREEKEKIGGKAPESSFSLTLEEDLSEKIFESPIKDLKISENLSEENECHEGEGLKGPSEIEAFQPPPFPISKDVEEIMEEEKVLKDFEASATEEEVAEESTFDTSLLGEVTPSIEDASERLEEVKGEAGKEVRGGGTTEKGVRGEEESYSSFPWIENFKDTVEAFYQRPRDIFSTWFEECRKGGEFINSLHALLTILVYSRFDQGNQPIKALENTQRVYRMILQRNLSLEEIQPLEGTIFISGEVWRDLFHRALPKVQQIGNGILEKSEWNAFDLERLIQVIPHMGHQNSRLAIRLIHELIPDIVEVDFSNSSVVIEDGLYRVASRLGIVDPHFDYFRGKNSMGDIKIQSFAKIVFPNNPTKIEEPMAWMGMEEERGGHCLPIQPQCGGCLFDTFCPKLHFNLNPSEKGMRK
jgi:hypothetical protein